MWLHDECDSDGAKTGANNAAVTSRCLEVGAQTMVGQYGGLSGKVFLLLLEPRTALTVALPALLTFTTSNVRCGDLARFRSGGDCGLLAILESLVSAPLRLHKNPPTLSILWSSIVP